MSCPLSDFWLWHYWAKQDCVIIFIHIGSSREITTSGSISQEDIWHQKTKYMDPSYTVWTVEADGSGVLLWVKLSWYTLSLLIPLNHHSNGTVYQSIAADHVPSFMGTTDSSSNSYSNIIVHHVTQTGYLKLVSCR